MNESENSTESGTEPVTEAPTEAPTESGTESAAEAPEESEDTIDLSEYIVTRNSKAMSGLKHYLVTFIQDISSATGITLKARFDNAKKSDPEDIDSLKEILIGTTKRQQSVEAESQLIEEHSYIVKRDGNKIVIIGTDGFALKCAIEHFIDTFVTGSDDGKITMENGYFYRSEKLYEYITSSIPQLRDPCILVDDDGTLYAYGTWWNCYRNTSGDLAGEWEHLGNLDSIVTMPEDADTDYWAPEVYKYNGAYYMITTYHSRKTGHRGCSVMRSDRPEGPFEEISDGHVTPHDRDAIDGTLYIDPDGQPWMIFVHEWTSTDDGVGRMDAAKLSDDLTHFISEPVELFRADSPSWSRSAVTDGCFMYPTADGQLLMIWSSSDSFGYCIGVARSRDGRVDGEWEQDDALLYSGLILGDYTGGHGMIFELDGQLWLSLHVPQNPTDTRKETPVFISLVEKDGTLVWGLN